MLFIFFLQACSTPQEVLINSEFEINSRSSSIDMHSLSSGKITLLGYRQLTDSVFAASQTDSFINLGLLFPLQRVRKEKYSHHFLFGTDTQQCAVYYNGLVQSLKTAPPIIKPSGSVPVQQETNKIADVQLNGYIQFAGSSNLFQFSYRNHEGLLLLYADSFKLKPVYQAAGKQMQTLVGVQLLKNNIVYAAVHSLTGLGKKKAFVYSKATPEEQLLTAAYLAVLARYL